MVVLTEQHGVLTDVQCAHVIGAHRAGLQPSQVSSGADRVKSLIRTSSGYRLPAGSLRPDIEKVLSSAVAEATGTDSARLEPWELLHYGEGAYYRPHLDWFDRHALEAAGPAGGQRTHSVILYLATVQGGGETSFPLLGKIVTPCRGMLVTWNNMAADKPLFEALHESCSVTAGEKWALVTWIRERPYVMAA